MGGRGPGAAIGGAARAALTFRTRLRRALVPAAFWVGWGGVAALLACGVLALVPDASWPAALDPDLLPFYAVLALCVASLVGWGCVQDGQTRVRHGIGVPAARIVFVVLPLVTAFLSFLDTHVLAGSIAAWPGRAWMAAVVRWYTPALVAVSLVTFLAWRTRPRKRIYLARGAWFLVLVAPYVLLLSVILFDLPALWVERPVQETLDTIGESSVAAHLIVGYFLGDAPAE